MGSGPGDLTGCTGIAVDIPQGTVIHVFSRVDDTASQTALSSTLGGQSGIATYIEKNSQFRYDEADKRAASLLDDLSQQNINISYNIAPYPLNFTTTYPNGESVLPIRPGRPVTVSLTSPFTLSETMTVRSVVLTPRSRRDNGEIVWNRQVNIQLQLQRSNESIGMLKQALDT